MIKILYNNILLLLNIYNILKYYIKFNIIDQKTKTIYKYYSHIFFFTLIIYRLIDTDCHFKTSYMIYICFRYKKHLILWLLYFLYYLLLYYNNIRKNTR